MGKYTTIRVPSEYQRTIKLLQNRIALKGIENLPNSFVEVLESCECPFCHKPLERVGAVDVIDYKCPTCGFAKPVFKNGNYILDTRSFLRYNTCIRWNTGENKWNSKQ